MCDAGWRASGNIRTEVVCNRKTSQNITTYLQENYYANYAMICFLRKVTVLRPEKSSAPDKQ